MSTGSSRLRASGRGCWCGWVCRCVVVRTRCEQVSLLGQYFCCTCARRLQRAPEAMRHYMGMCCNNRDMCLASYRISGRGSPRASVVLHIGFINSSNGRCCVLTCWPVLFNYQLDLIKTVARNEAQCAGFVPPPLYCLCLLL